MPRHSSWTGVDVVIHCPHCDTEWRIPLHPGLLACPHNPELARGDCEMCQREVLSAGMIMKPATPPEPPTPPPPPMPMFAPPSFPYGQPLMSPGEQAEIDRSMREQHAEFQHLVHGVERDANLCDCLSHSAAPFEMLGGR